VPDVGLPDDGRPDVGLVPDGGLLPAPRPPVPLLLSLDILLPLAPWFIMLAIVHF